MRRLVWLVAGLALLAAGLWLAGRAPSAYVLGKLCERYSDERKARFNVLRSHRSKADPPVAAEIDRKIDELLRETKTVPVRGWEVVLVPAGAMPPGAGYALGARFDPPDPPPFEYMDAWIRPKGWLARLFSRR